MAHFPKVSLWLVAAGSLVVKRDVDSRTLGGAGVREPGTAIDPVGAAGVWDDNKRLHR